MQFPTFLLHMKVFHREFHIDVSPGGRWIKLQEELKELNEAVALGAHDQVKDETIDVLVCVIAFAVSLGIVNLLDACYFKMDKTAKKYRAAGLYDNPKAGL